MTVGTKCVHYFFVKIKSSIFSFGRSYLYFKHVGISMSFFYKVCKVCNGIMMFLTYYHNVAKKSVDKLKYARQYHRSLNSTTRAPTRKAT